VWVQNGVIRLIAISFQQVLTHFIVVLNHHGSSIVTQTWPQPWYEAQVCFKQSVATHGIDHVYLLLILLRPLNLFVLENDHWVIILAKRFLLGNLLQGRVAGLIKESLILCIIRKNLSYQLWVHLLCRDVRIILIKIHPIVHGHGVCSLLFWASLDLIELTVDLLTC
jgi:hypothetical protein